ncbi:hypothetical protein AB1Y20_010122 [Prymnesium parvum]|uniref:Myb-like domain-containing protein n=1 Tax=Prymnesium parvum TaxID=97485 RepID=A0AB34K6I1_PRYPA
MTIASDAFHGADQPTNGTPPTLFSAPSRSGIGDARHRRWVSDPTDPTPRQLPAALFDVRELDEDTSDLSRKDGLVPMWTVEEDLLILQLVDTYGKRWSKIAAHLPGRTDNGVRNRWNRMQRAQVLRESRGAEAGYRCRRCGQPKRGHICAALTRAGEAPAGDELEEQAQALTRLAADKMRPPAVCVESSVESSSVDDFAQGSGVLSAEEQQQLSHLAAAADSIMKQFPPELSSRTSSFDEAGLDIDELLQRLQRHELDGEARVEESSASAPPFPPTLLPKRTASADFFMDLDSMLEELQRGELQRHSLAHIGRGVSSPFSKRSSIRVHAS